MTTTNLCIAAAASVVAFIGGVTQAPIDDTWGKVIAGGGAASLVAGLFVYVLRHTGAQQEKRDQVFSSTIEKCSDKFGETVEKQADSFSQTATMLLREGRESSERREKQLLEALTGARKP